MDKLSSINYFDCEYVSITSGLGLMVLEGKTPNTVPAVRVPLTIRARVKSQEYVECRGPRGNSRLTTVAGNPRLPKKKKKNCIDT